MNFLVLQIMKSFCRELIVSFGKDKTIMRLKSQIAWNS